MINVVLKQQKEFMDIHFLQDFLKDIQKPAQYLGNEVNAVHKDFSKQQVRVALIFPDAYEMGMSHTGLKILYEILNSIDGVVAERCFAPGIDLEKKLRDQNLPLFSLESKTNLNEFDIIGISLPYELTYTNALNIIDLAQIPLFQKDRQAHHPLILGGGTQSYNPEPMADFFDAIAIGDGEELIVDFVSCVLNWKNKHHIDLITQNKNQESRQDILEALTHITGLYVPQFFEPEYHPDGKIKSIKPLLPHYQNVKKRIVADLNSQPYPTKLVVPNIKLIHDRIGIEIQRGCTRMCRFCQAGYIERPTRQRSPERVLEIAEKSLQQTGLDEISLLSLSAGDYQTIVPTLKELNGRYKKQNISISVPATRTETLTKEMIQQIKQVRMSGFTIAPEAGSERMRRVINKGNKVEDLLTACRNAFSSGYRLIKFYYMCGLPFETDEDVINIANESRLALQVGQEYNRNIQINVSVSSFVPKPFTPFQWVPQMTIEETERKHHLIKTNLKDRKLQFKHHDARQSYLEGLFARGDRRLSQVIYQAFTNGCRFDEWREHFDFSKWQLAFSQTGVDLHFYLHRERDQTEIFPWDHLFSQMRKDWLWQEFEAAKKEAYIADCSVDKCAQFCGACDFKEVKNKIFVIDENPLAVKKGNREWYGRFKNNTENTPVVAATTPGEETQPEERQKIRVVYSKTGLAALTGHLELMTVIKRALLRCGVKAAYSQGFHPQMKISMSAPLPLGVESEAESFDLVVTQPVDIETLPNQLNASLPDGFKILDVKLVDLNAPSIYGRTSQINYEAIFPKDLFHKIAEQLAQNMSSLQKGDDLFFTREKSAHKKETKTFNLKEILELPHYSLATNDHSLRFSTKVNETGSIRPTEVIKALTKIEPHELIHVKLKKTGTVFRESL